jgi:hypothetical protein
MAASERHFCAACAKYGNITKNQRTNMANTEKIKSLL